MSDQQEQHTSQLKPQPCLSTVKVTLSLKNCEIIVGIFVLILFLVTFALVGDEGRIVLKFFLNCITVIAAVFAAMFAGRAMSISRENARQSEIAQQAMFETNLETNREMYQETVRSQKMRMAYDMVQCLGESSNVKVREELRKDIDSSENNDADQLSQYDRIAADPQLNLSLVHVLGTFEDIAIAIKRDIVDEEFLRDSLRAMVVQYYESFEGYIKGLRKRTNNPRYYCELENLRNSWNKTSS